MRLLELIPGGGFCLVEYIENIPRYAILSHTWLASAEEVTFQDLQNGTGIEKKGYKKLEFCARQTAIDHLRYFWVDTCCIDKTNSTELQEAINSMFRWYRASTKCYVYLTDVSEAAWKSEFSSSRWFTRGWTLQELLAPTSVEFYSKESTRFGNRHSLLEEIHKISGIATGALEGRSLILFSVQERFSWPMRRQTTREEDMAYSLLGIFDVSMPLIIVRNEQAAAEQFRPEISACANLAVQALYEKSL